MMKSLVLVTIVCLSASNALDQTCAEKSSQSGAITLEPSDSALARAIVPLMQEWRQAISKADSAVLVRVAFSEDREAVAAALHNRRSPLYRTLYLGPGSYRALLANPATRIAVFERDMFAGSHNYATACFFKGQLRWPRSYITLQEMTRRGNVRCLDWVFTEGEENKWYVSYGFALPE